MVNTGYWETRFGNCTASIRYKCIFSKRIVKWLNLINNICFQGFKGEWMTVKDHVLYVGGFGKPTNEYFNIFRTLSVFERQLYNLNTLLFDCFTLFIFHNFITRWR